MDNQYSRKLGGNTRKRTAGRKNKKHNCARCLKRCSQQREGKIKKKQK